MKKVIRSLPLLGVVLGNMLGGFGSNGGRRSAGPELGEVISRGMRDGSTKKNANRIASDRRNRHRTGHGKGHRRTYLCGKPAIRT